MTLVPAGTTPGTLGSASVAIQFNMQSVRVTVASRLAEFPEPTRPVAHFLQRARFGHEQNLVPRDVALQRREHMLELLNVVRPCHNELELVGILVNPRAHHLRLPARGLVFLSPDR